MLNLTTLTTLEADAIYAHGDMPGSDQLAAELRAGLQAAGISVKAVGAS